MRGAFWSRGGWIALVLFAIPAAIPGAESNGKRPNFLWLIAEDFGQHLGCFGTKEVWTPALDRLASQGVRYTRFYCTAPVCSASRSAFMTGMYQTTIGAHNHRSHRDDDYRLPEGVRPLPDWLREAGYFTANIRKLAPPCDFPGTGKTDWNFNYDNKPFDSDRWEDLKAHQPFYAQVNFKETHRTFVAPKRADPAKVEIPPYYPDHPLTRADWAAYLDSASQLDTRIDAVLKLLEADGLADNTVVVFFGDNGQAHVRGKQFVYEEGLLVPLIVRWPKGIPAPKHYQAGSVDNRLLMTIDLAPTMLDLAGAKIPVKMEGQPFLGQRTGQPRKYVFGARDRCDETVFRLRTVRDERYRYIRNFTPDKPFLSANKYKEKQYPVWTLLKELDEAGKLTSAQKSLTAPHMPAEELYDMQADPHQIHNLADSSDGEHQSALRRLRVALDQWIRETNDKGQIPEPAAVAAAEGKTKPAAEGPAASQPPPKKKKRRP